MPTKNAPSAPLSQIDKFKEAAREAQTDDNEERFDRALKNVAKKPLSPRPPRPKS